MCHCWIGKTLPPLFAYFLLHCSPLVKFCIKVCRYDETDVQMCHHLHRHDCHSFVIMKGKFLLIISIAQMVLVTEVVVNSAGKSNKFVLTLKLPRFNSIVQQSSMTWDNQLVSWTDSEIIDYIIFFLYDKWCNPGDSGSYFWRNSNPGSTLHSKKC